MRYNKIIIINIIVIIKLCIYFPTFYCFNRGGGWLLLYFLIDSGEVVCE